MISVNVETAKRLYVTDLKEEHNEDKTQNFN